jgi:photosystem II stability/assembly factor-like uncharacterized protein
VNKIKNAFIQLLLSCFLIFGGCEHDKIITPPRPEGWIALELSNVQVNRLVLSGDWLYACANKGGLYRIKHPANEGDQWQFLGLADARIEIGDFGVTDVIILNDTIVVGNSGNFAPDIAGIYRSINDGMSWVVSDSGFIKNQIYTSSAFVRRLAQSPFEPQMILAGCRGAFLLYLSYDFGRSWNMIFDLFDGAISFHAVGFHPSRQNEIWVGGRVPNSGRPLLYRSTDLGATWEELLKRPHAPGDPRQWDNVKEIVFDPADEQMVFVCMNRVILTTTDSGNSWTPSDTLISPLHSLSLNPFNNQEFIAGAFDTLYHSLDGMQSWAVLETTPESVDTDMRTLAVDWQKRILYVATYSVLSPLKGVYKLYF